MIQDLKKRAQHRIKILEGQMRGVQKMIDQDQYCMDIITQNLAIQKSLQSLNKLIVENHIKTHVKDGMKSSQKVERDQAVRELLELYELTKNRS